MLGQIITCGHYIEISFTKNCCKTQTDITHSFLVIQEAYQNVLMNGNTFLACNKKGNISQMPTCDVTDYAISWINESLQLHKPTKEYNLYFMSL